MTRMRGRHPLARLGFALLGLAILAAACDSTSEPSRSPAPGASATPAGPSPLATAPTPAPPGPGGGSVDSVDPSPRVSEPPASDGTSPDPASPTPSDSPSIGVPRPAPDRPFLADDKGLRGEVFAFVTIDQLADAAAGLDWPATSTVVFFSLAASGTGRLVHDARWTAWNSRKADALIERAHETGTKVVFSLSRFSWSPSATAISAALLDSVTSRDRLATEVADEVVRRGVDGVNVDFEPIPAGQKAHFTDLVGRIRHELDARGPGYQLTFDVLGHFESYDVAGALGAGADAVYLMGYHYAGTFSSVAHATAPLGGPRYSVGDAIRGLREVAAPSRILVGVPYYGHLWPTASGARNARVTGGGGDVAYREARRIALDHPPTYDPAEAVEWSAWRVRDCATCALHWVQLYFDDARSLGAKWTEYRRQGLLGTGYWTWGFQGETSDLADALRAVWLASGG